jgi:mRNA interferase MazF
MVKSNFIPDRGDVVWLSFSPKAGHEQAGRRSALVLSPAAYNEKVGLSICCPITSKVKGYPFEVSIPKKCKVEGVVLSDQVKSLDWRTRESEFIYKLPANTVNEVLARLSTLFK